MDCPNVLPIKENKSYVKNQCDGWQELKSNSEWARIQMEKDNKVWKWQGKEKSVRNYCGWAMHMGESCITICNTWIL